MGEALAERDEAGPGPAFNRRTYLFIAKKAVHAFTKAAALATTFWAGCLTMRHSLVAQGQNYSAASRGSRPLTSRERGIVLPLIEVPARQGPGAPVYRARFRMAPAMFSSGITLSTPFSLIASFGIPKTTQVASADRPFP